MATLTIRHIPEAIIERLKAIAKRKGHSMEQEVRELLATRYAARNEITARVRQRWDTLPSTSEADVRTWCQIGRP
jgi:plasmid stability protein